MPETPNPRETGPEAKGLRDWLLRMPELLVSVPYALPRWKIGKVRGYAALLGYGCSHPVRGKRRTPVDVEAQVIRWKQVIIDLALAHNADRVDAADFALDDILEPILAAPVAQLRQFYRRLTEELKADERVPFIVWRTFEQWATGVLDPAPDQGVLELKDQLAQYIAAAVEKDVQPDLMQAMADALKWRPEGTLQGIKQALDEGGQPRVRGRQSCLFLEVGEYKVML